MSRGAPNHPINMLLVRPELGRTRQTTYDLPEDPGFTFGKKLPGDPEGAGALVSQWVEHKPNPDALPGRDFKALNYASIRKGYVTAKQQQEFRLTHDARLKTGKNTSATPSSLPSNHDPIHTYGKPGRPSTPLEKLIKNEFAAEFNAAAEASASAASVSKQKIPVMHTRASLGHMIHTEQQNQIPDASTLWKMGRFQDVPAKTKSRRDGPPPSTKALAAQAAATTASMEQSV
eukprot:tig00000350_g24332.t1